MAPGEDDSSRNGDAEAFLASCAGSGHEAYGVARAVLERLLPPATRADVLPATPPPGRRSASAPPASASATSSSTPTRKNFVVFHSRAVAIENYLPLFSPALAIVDEHLTRYLPLQWLASSEIEGRADGNHAEDAITVTEAPHQSDLLIELVRKLKPQVYSDLEVAFAISEDASVCKALSQTIELLEGHTSVISQRYYGSLFHELLVFQIGDRHQHAHQVRQAVEVIPKKTIRFSNSAMSTLKEAEFFAPDSKGSSVIHMDLHRSFLPVPSPLSASILESFAQRNIMNFETDVRSSIEELVGDNYGLPGDSLS